MSPPTSGTTSWAATRSSRSGSPTGKRRSWAGIFFQKKCTLHRYGTADWGETGAGERVMKGFLIRWEGVLWVAAVLLMGAIGAMVTWWWWWEELRDNEESLSATVRNLALVIGGIIAVLLAVWRSRVAERQAVSAQQQVEISQGRCLPGRRWSGAPSACSAARRSGGPASLAGTPSGRGGRNQRSLTASRWGRGACA